MAESKKIIAVVGVTGKQGSAIAKTFLSIAGWHVRGITRNTSSPQAVELRSAGVELVTGDLDDASTLIPAFSGAHVIFGTTDFFALLRYPNLVEYLGNKYPGLSMPQACWQHELQQGKNIASAASSVLAKEGVLETYIFSSCSHAKKWSHGKITNLLHFDIKAEIEDSIRSEHKELAAKTSYLYVGWYLDNLWFPFLKPEKQSDGVYVFRWPALNEDTWLPAIDTSKDAGVFAKALVDAPHGTVLLGEAERVTAKEVCDLWAGAMNGKAVFAPAEPEVAAKQIDAAMPGFGWEFVENFQYYRDFGYDGGDPRVKFPKDLGIDTSRLTTVKQYVESKDWSSLF